MDSSQNAEGCVDTCVKQEVCAEVPNCPTETPCCNQVEFICPVDSIEAPGGLCVQNETKALSKMQDYQGQEIPKQFDTAKNMLKTTSFSLHKNIDDVQKQFSCCT